MVEAPAHVAGAAVERLLAHLRCFSEPLPIHPERVPSSPSTGLDRLFVLLSGEGTAGDRVNFAALFGLRDDASLESRYDLVGTHPAGAGRGRRARRAPGNGRERDEP